MDRDGCAQSELTFAYALEALELGAIPAAEAHIAACATCRRDLSILGTLIDCFVAWPTDVLRPRKGVEARLCGRIQGKGAQARAPSKMPWSEPEWDAVAPGIECKLLASDRARKRVSMLVRLLPGAKYPAHTHAGTEELHLLAGELWIDGRKLMPGDYSFGTPGTSDARVWSESGCTCVLTTSSQDILQS